MKLAAGWLPTLAIALATATGGCSVNHRSGDFTCQSPSDCATDRTCVDGYCVELDSGACPAACTTCDPGQKSCAISCELTGSCAQTVTCPPGWSCTVTCSGENACRGGINCQNGTSCAVTCSGVRSCVGITCGSGPCDVACSGTGSCQGVACAASCACDVTCRLNASCLNLTCTSNCMSADGCTSTGRGCDRCP